MQELIPESSSENSLTHEQWQNSQENEAAFWLSQKSQNNLEQRQRNDYYRGLLEDGCDIAKRFFEQDFSDKVIVDVGSGPEGILHVLEAKRKIAIDPLMDIFFELGYEVNSDNVEMLCMTGEEFSLDEPADVIVCLNAIDHTRDPDATVKNIGRNLKTEGEFLLLTDMRKPDQLDDYHKIPVDICDIQNWILFDKNCQNTGLEIIEEHVFPHQKGNPVMQYIAWCRKYS